MKFKLRTLISIGLVLMMVMSLAACGSTPSSQSQTPALSTSQPAAPQASEPAKKPFEGQIIRYVAANHMWNDTIKPLIPEFEAETGMKVSLESYEES